MSASRPAPVRTDKPILFSAPMIRALLREARQPGTGKTQTRRVLKKQPIQFATDDKGTLCDVGCLHVQGNRRPRITLGRVITLQELPYAVGDRLWVKEAWQVARETLDYETGGEYDVYAWDDKDYGDPRPYLNGCARGGVKSGLFYAADGEDENPSVFYPLIGFRNEVLRPAEIPWRSGRFMPRWASRLTLLVTEVRIQRLTDISEADAVAEGVEHWPAGSPYFGNPYGVRLSEYEYCSGETARSAFQALWQTIHSPDAWAQNSWVAATTFTPVEANIDALPAAALPHHDTVEAC